MARYLAGFVHHAVAETTRIDTPIYIALDLDGVDVPLDYCGLLRATDRTEAEVAEMLGTAPTILHVPAGSTAVYDRAGIRPEDRPNVARLFAATEPTTVGIEPVDPAIRKRLQECLFLLTQSAYLYGREPAIHATSVRAFEAETRAAQDRVNALLRLLGP